MRQGKSEDELPAWSLRLRREREARGWSQADAVQALRAHSADTLPGDATTAIAKLVGEQVSAGHGNALRVCQAMPRRSSGRVKVS